MFQIVSVAGDFSQIPFVILNVLDLAFRKTDHRLELFVSRCVEKEPRFFFELVSLSPVEISVGAEGLPSPLPHLMTD